MSQIAFVWLYLAVCVRGQRDRLLQHWCCCLAAVSIAYTASNAELIGTMISCDDVSDDYSTGDEIEIIWSPGMVTRKVQRMLRWAITAAVKWTLDI